MPDRILEWLTPWEPSLVAVFALAAAGALYMRGSARMHPTPVQRLCFWAGWIFFYAALQTHADYYAEHVFFLHRAQHAVLHHIAPFLIALAQPGAVLTAALPACLRLRAPACFNHPVVAAALFCVLIVFWLLPPVHFLAMLDWRLYRVMNWGMAVNGLMFWSLALNGRLPPARRILMMLAVIPPQIAIGMLIFASPHELYPLYSLCGRALGIGALQDQQLGGFILWVPAAMTSVTGVLLVMRRAWFGSVRAAG